MELKYRKSIHWIIILVIIGIGCYLLVNGYLSDTNELKKCLNSFGYFAPLIFILIQIIQVVIPILPGGVSNSVGVVLFGPYYGFIYNYVGLMIGSVIAFILVKKYGESFILKFVSQKTYDKYIKLLDSGKWFDIFFAIAIFIPGLPDDLICMIAALTNMTLTKFTMINLVCKPMVLIFYSLGIQQLINLF